jgi:hypothetical protein
VRFSGILIYGINMDKAIEAFKAGSAEWEI